MNELSLTSLFSYNFSLGNEPSFKVSYKDYQGNTLNGLVRAINKDHYEVYIQEKGVIINCTTNEKGVLSCSLNRHRNPAWVDGISREVELKVKQLM